jgi:hypothetical protein
MKNIVELAAWMYVAKIIFPVVGFVVVAVVVGEFMDDVTDREYNGTKLRIRRKRKDNGDHRE